MGKKDIDLYIQDQFCHHFCKLDVPMRFHLRRKLTSVDALIGKGCNGW